MGEENNQNHTLYRVTGMVQCEFEYDETKIKQNRSVGNTKWNKKHIRTKKSECKLKCHSTAIKTTGKLYVCVCVLAHTHYPCFLSNAYRFPHLRWPPLNKVKWVILLSLFVFVVCAATSSADVQFLCGRNLALLSHWIIFVVLIFA